MAKGPPRPPANSGGKRGSSDLVRLYLQDIGRVDLLSHEEELTLARLVQRREQLLQERRTLAKQSKELQALWTWSTAASSWPPIWGTGPACSCGPNTNNAAALS